MSTAPTPPPRAEGDAADGFRLRVPAVSDPDSLFDAFVTWLDRTGVTMYPAQEEAVLALLSGDHVVMTTPTGSGKSLVAVAAHFACLARGRRSMYTAPIKALVSEKFFQLRSVFGPDAVGMITGDAQIAPDAPIICATAEILAHQLLAARQAGEELGSVTMDEFHFVADRERGWAWELPLLVRSSIQFLLMSATLGDTSWIERSLGSLESRGVSVVGGAERPVPLEFSYRSTALLESISSLLERGRAPVYLVHFTQRSAAEQAQALTSLDVLDRSERTRLGELLRGHRFDTPFGKDLKRYLAHGVAVHHAGLLPRYRLLVERLAGEGLLKLICGTDTLGVGVNVPIRTVLFTQLCKFDGARTRLLSVREFHQIAGRAGRKGFDDLGTVWAQAPAHVVENLIAERKAVESGRKKKVVRKPAPVRGFTHWDEATFERLVASPPDTLGSRFRIPQSALVAAVHGGGDVEARLAGMVDASRLDDDATGRELSRLAEMVDSMVAAGILRRVAHVESEPLDPGATRERGASLEVGPDVPDDLALDSVLSSFLIEVVGSLDPDSDTFLPDVLAVLEATLDDPRPVLLAQRDEARGRLYQELKAAGVPFEERQERLAEVDHPRPLADELAAMLTTYCDEHPWLLGAPLRPKCVAYDMYCSGDTFSTYVQRLGVKRSEGVLLRYLGDVWRACRRTLPPAMMVPALEEFVAWLGFELRRVDSSLLDEWDRLEAAAAGRDVPESTATQPGADLDVTADRVVWRAAIRRQVFKLVERLATGRLAEVAAVWPDADEAAVGEMLARLGGREPGDLGDLDPAPVIDIGAAARGSQLVEMWPGDDVWRVVQHLVDVASGDTIAWLDVSVGVDASRAAGDAVVTIDGLRSPAIN